MMHFPYEDWRTGRDRPEPVITEDPIWLRRLIRAANIAAGVAICALPFALMLWKGWL